MAERRWDLSVVIPSVNGWADLRDALAALARQDVAAALEIIVVDRVGAALRDRLGAEYPHARLIEVSCDTTIPRMRSLGFDAASADVVAVIEDHVIVPPEWARQMLEAHREGARVVGGAVENAARERLSDRAAFLCEYHQALSPPPRGPAAWLTGNNVTYRRELLLQFRDVIHRGNWEHELHDAMRRAGVTLESRPEIRVGHKKHFTVAEYASQRYLYSRAFAGMRVRGTGLARRLAFGLGALALPPVLLYRIVTRAWREPAHRRELVAALPLLVPYVCAWAGGEAMGSWFGPGDALARVR